MLHIELSRHADHRASQRNLNYDDIVFIVEHGKRQRRAGVIFVQMWAKKLPKRLRSQDERARLVGSTVVMCPCGRFVITVYRDPKAFQRDRKKSKFDCRDGIVSCPCCQANRLSA